MVRFTEHNLPKSKRSRGQIKAGLRAIKQSADEEGKKHKISNRPEEKIQVAVVSHAKTWPLRELLDERWWPWEIRKGMVNDWLYHVPNQRAEIAHRMFLKNMGVKAGVSDLHFDLPVFNHDRAWAGLYLETKAGDNDLTEKQEIFLKNRMLVGHAGHGFRSVSEFEEHIKWYLTGSKPIVELMSK
jgi:hypothetical protein